MSVTFSVTAEDASGGLWVVSVAGDIDLYTTPQLRDRLNAAVESRATGVAVDLAGTAFIDSSGLGALIGAHGRLRERGGRLALFGVGDEIARALELTGLDQVLPVLGSRDEALAFLAAG